MCYQVDPYIGVSYDGSGAYYEVANVKNLNVSRSTDKFDRNYFKMGKYKKSCPGKTEVSISFDIDVDYGDAGQRVIHRANMRRTTPVYFKINYTTADGAEEYYVRAYIESDDKTKDEAGGLIQRSYSLAIVDFAEIIQQVS